MRPSYFTWQKFMVLFLITVNHTCLISAQNNNELVLTGLKTEYYTDPVGIDVLSPRLSWLLVSDNRNIHQAAWQVQVAGKKESFTAGNLIWDTGKVSSNISVHNSYSGPALESGQRYFWRVRVWDNNENVSPWSDISFWETGLLNPDDWESEWIEPDFDEDISVSQPAPMLRSEFSLKTGIVSARAYVTAHGLYEMHINGRRVGQDLFTPGWTSYHQRLQYQTYDITGHLQEGENAVGVWLGDGWFRGYLGWGDQRNSYGEKLGLLARLEIRYEDGSVQVISTGEKWKSSTGPILESDIYNGEVYDARLEKSGWTMPGFNDESWTGVRLTNHGKQNLIAQQAPPVREIQLIRPLEIFTTPAGDMVADMGQNMIGWIRLRVRGPAGTKVTLRHAEVLDSDGNFYTDNLRSADQTNTYILKGGEAEVWEPRFTFQGFRYVAIDGFPGQLTADDLTGVVIHSVMEPTGHFQSSHPLVNQLQHNIIWGQKGNFLEVPTDCPQRDERLGWTGDIQVFAPTANINMFTAGFLTKWLGDLSADQNEAGSIPHVVPNVLGDQAYGSAGWGDAGLIVPRSLYRYFGDTRILGEQYESMKAWVEYIRTRAAANEKPYLWNIDFSFADWLSYSTSSNAHYPGAYTDYRMVATMFFAHSTDLLRQAAEILGKEEDVKEYTALFENIKAAFQNEYLTPGGRVMSDTQTAYVLALKFNLLPSEMVSVAIDNLVAEVQSRGHLTTGFLGTPHLNPVLSRFGHNETAFDLLINQDYPSWLYPVTRGATTIWERWDGIKPDGSFQSEGMNSFNHYAYGAIGEWLYEEVAGIQPFGPGYKTIGIKPSPGGGLTHARAIINSMYGKIESSWEFDNNQFTLFVEVPPNTSAVVTLPEALLEEVTIDGQPGSENSVNGLVQFGTEVMAQVGSGKYTFSYRSEELFKQANIEEQDDIPIFTIDNKIGELLAVKQSREIIYRHLPELAGSPWISQVMGFTLKQAMFSLPEQFRVSNAVLNRIQEDLKKLI
ncbi:MAG: family 78 glycoside hydrolase catalytic domain [Bacteroidales bacterium]